MKNQLNVFIIICKFDQNLSNLFKKTLGDLISEYLIVFDGVDCVWLSISMSFSKYIFNHVL